MQHSVYTHVTGTTSHMVVEWPKVQDGTNVYVVSFLYYLGFLELPSLH